MHPIVLSLLIVLLVNALFSLLSLYDTKKQLEEFKKWLRSR